MTLDRTWDGLPVSQDPPFGAAVVVFRRAPDRLLLLHRHHHGPDYAGDWAWTPPSGSRLPGEDIADCAVRELAEEAGITGLPVGSAVVAVPVWTYFAVELPDGAEVRLVDPEHDRFEWVPVADALARVLPATVTENLALVCARLGLVP